MGGLGHTESQVGGEVAPGADRAEGALDSDHPEQSVVRVNVRGVEPELRANIARRDPLQAVGSWDVRQPLGRRCRVFEDVDARVAARAVELEASAKPGSLDLGCVRAGLGFRYVHRLEEQDHESVAPPLRHVRSTVRAEAEDAL